MRSPQKLSLDRVKYVRLDFSLKKSETCGDKSKSYWEKNN